MSKHLRPLIVAAAGFVCLCVADACNRDLTEPRVQGAASPRAPGKPDFNIVSSPDQITATTSSPSVWTGAETNVSSSPIATFPTATWYRVDASGRITMTPDPRFMPGQPTLTYGPANHARFTWGDGNWNNTTTQIANGPSDSTGNVYVQMSISLLSADRPGYGAVNWNAYCGVGYSDPCGDYSGPPTTFTFTRLNADLNLTADSTSVAPGSTVTFTYGASPTQVEGQTMPVVVDSVRWAPDTGGPGAEKTEQGYQGGSNSCSASTKTCTRQIIGSGTFTLIAWVNGKAITKSVHIQTPSLKLVAVRQWGAKARNVVFTPSWSDGALVTPTGTSWAWRPDSGSAQTTACGAGTSPCTTRVQEIGTMTVTVTRSGVHRTASAHVTVVPCAVSDTTDPTKQDSILDDPVVRRFADSLWKLSKASDTANRIERGMLVYDSAGITVVHIKPIDLSQDHACGNGVADWASQDSVHGGTLIAVFHTHPAAVGDTVVCHDPANTVIHGYSDQFGGPSPADWEIAKAHATGMSPPVPNWYAFDVNNMYHYDATNVDGDFVTQPNGSEPWVPHLPGQTNPYTNGYRSVQRNQGSCTIFSVF